MIIRDFFNDRRDGFYVDVGAAWGDKVSTTLYLDKELGWRGIGIDALSLYEDSWLETRPRSRFCNFAISDRSGEQLEFFKAKIPTLSSLYPEQLHIWTLKQSQVKKIEVESITLDDLLEQQGVSSFDFLSIDVEGAEPKVLNGFTIARYQPELVCIEANGAIDTGDRIMDYFVGNDYRRLWEYDERDPANWYFARI